MPKGDTHYIYRPADKPI